jgi:3-oxocholest-4-en-26-oate---CoA ligase
VRDKLPNVKRWYVVADETGSGPAWASDYEAVVSTPVQGPVKGPWGRSGDDLLLLYTGGTTGMPKGVMWRQDDLWNVLGSGGNVLFGFDPVASMEELAARTTPDRKGPAVLVACPLMHGTGQFSAMIGMGMGGAVVSLAGRKFDVAELWDTVQRRKATSVVIVGDAFAKPMLAELEANPGKYDLSSLAAITSSGVMWSQETKDGLLRHAPHIFLFDSHGSSEAVGLSGSLSTKDGTAATAAFQLGANAGVFTEDGKRVEPGSGESGMVAVTGFIPVGYYKDEAKTAATFRTFEGRRWSVPGDWAEVNADGSLTLLGRGSQCINTGGEKVFPEEVEEALKRHGKVADAVCVGIPDERFGETICAVVELTDQGREAEPTLDELSAHVRASLAAYKAPRHVVVVDTIGRAANGKVDYKGLKQLSLGRLGQ